LSESLFLPLWLNAQLEKAKLVRGSIIKPFFPTCLTLQRQLKDMLPDKQTFQLGQCFFTWSIISWSISNIIFPTLVDFKHNFPYYANQISIPFNLNILLVIIKSYHVEIGGEFA